MAHEAHHKSAEHHEEAAKHHHLAAEHHIKGDHKKAHDHATQAHEHSVKPMTTPPPRTRRRAKQHTHTTSQVLEFRGAARVPLGCPPGR